MALKKERNAVSMKSEMLDGMVVYVTVVELGSFSSAAERLGHSPSFISKEISKLEKRLGVRLLNRTTRSLTLTDAGLTYFERCRQIVIDAENAEFAMGALQETPKGVLKISAPISMGSVHLEQLLTEFLKTYPEVDLDIHYSQRKVDVVAEGFDLAIRAGTLKESNLIAKKVGVAKGVFIASPDYIAKHGEPKSMDELQHHRVISYANVGTPKYWEVTDKHGKSHSAHVNPRIITNSSDFEVVATCAGLGITRLPAHLCLDELKSGQLIEILKDIELDDIGIYVVYPHRQYLSAKVKVFIEFMQQHLKIEMW